MGRALELARQALVAEEVPVGAVVVLGGEVVGEGENRTRRDSDPTAHAEVVALREAARHQGDFRLEGATLYVTVEPCLMCLGAILIARISRLVYGCPEPKFGALRSRFKLAGHERFRRLAMVGGVGEEESRSLLRAFFEGLRAEDG